MFWVWMALVVFFYTCAVIELWRVHLTLAVTWIVCQMICLLMASRYLGRKL
jgi:hypothetical protein